MRSIRAAAKVRGPSRPPEVLSAEEFGEHLSYCVASPRRPRGDARADGGSFRQLTTSDYPTFGTRWTRSIAAQLISRVRSTRSMGRAQRAKPRTHRRATGRRDEGTGGRRTKTANRSTTATAADAPELRARQTKITSHSRAARLGCRTFGSISCAPSRRTPLPSSVT